MMGRRTRKRTGRQWRKERQRARAGLWLAALLLCLLCAAGCAGQQTAPPENAEPSASQGETEQPAAQEPGAQPEEVLQTDAPQGAEATDPGATQADAVPAARTQSKRAGDIAIRLATDYRADAIGYRVLEDFARRLEEKSEGAVQVKLYRSGEWSNAGSFAEYLRLGNLEMACLRADVAEALQPAYAIYQQPYLFSAMTETAAQYVESDAAQTALSLLPEAYRGVGFVPDGYLYLLQQGAEPPRWVSYGEMLHLSGTKALEGTAVFDLQAIYSLQPLAAQAAWWDGLTETQQGWIRDSLREAVATSFAEQAEEPQARALAAGGVVFQDMTSEAQNSYANQYMAQREAYFASHADALTAHWRAAPVIGGEESASP